MLVFKVDIDTCEAPLSGWPSPENIQNLLTSFTKQSLILQKRIELLLNNDAILEFDFIASTYRSALMAAALLGLQKPKNTEQALILKNRFEKGLQLVRIGIQALINEINPSTAINYLQSMRQGALDTYTSARQAQELCE